MKKVAWLLLPLSVLSGQRIELWSGEIIPAPGLLYRDGRFILADTVILRSEVKKVLMEGEEPEVVLGQAAEVGPILELAQAAAERYPDAGGIILADDGEFILNSDSTQVYRYSFQGKILKEKCIEWASVKIYYEDEERRVRLLGARTIKPDGRVFELAPEEAKVVRASEGDVHFGRGKWFSFTLPQVSVGDVVEYAYEMEIFNPWDRAVFNPGYYFQWDEPIVRSSLKITVPIGQPLIWATRNFPEGRSEPVVTESAGFRSYYWELNWVEPIVPEPGMPPLVEVVARLEASNQPTWDHIFDWYARFQTARMEPTPRIESLVDSLTEGLSEPEEIVARLYHWVQRNIRYISIKGAAASGVSGHPAHQTLENGYGDCTDKAILFATMLRAAGVEANMVYVGTNNEVSSLMPEVPSYYGNHAITWVELPDTGIYLDATGYYSRYPSFWAANHGVWAVDPLRRTIEPVPVPLPEANCRRYEYELELSPEFDLRVKFQASYTGDYEALVRGYWDRQPEEDRLARVQEMVAEIHANSKVVSYELEHLEEIAKPFYLRLEYELYDYPDRAGDLLILKLPGVADRYEFPEVSLSQRRLPIAYPTSVQITHRVRLSIPDNYQVASLPEPLSIATPYGSYEASYRQDGGVIYFEDSFKRHTRVIPKEEYPEYQRFCQAVAEYQRSRLFLQGR